MFFLSQGLIGRNASSEVWLATAQDGWLKRFIGTVGNHGENIEEENNLPFDTYSFDSFWF